MTVLVVVFYLDLKLEVPWVDGGGKHKREREQPAQMRKCAECISVPF